jgi:hypothetical protein
MTTIIVFHPNIHILTPVFSFEAQSIKLIIFTVYLNGLHFQTNMIWLSRQEISFLNRRYTGCISGFTHEDTFILLALLNVGKQLKLNSPLSTLTHSCLDLDFGTWKFNISLRDEKYHVLIAFHRK